MSIPRKEVSLFVKAIQASGFSIYDQIEVGSDIYVPSAELETILDKGLQGFSIEGYALRTRSKVVKGKICKLLGYPVPTSFKRTQPCFPGQNFDAYVQSSNNLQIWNAQLNPTRRYVLIHDTDGLISKVRVVTGETLAVLDTTGTLTQKYQARLVSANKLTELISKRDTRTMAPLVSSVPLPAFVQSPLAYPERGHILPILSVFERLKALVGKKFVDRGIDQERNRGGDLHRMVCEVLGYRDFADDGRFPDVKHQVLEVKLQTSSTIDLGLITPDSIEPLDMPKTGNVQIRHCDVRYAIFSASTDGTTVCLERLYLTTGKAFFSRFPRFGGKVLNKKLQLRLPSGFFSDSKS